eukprot:4643131-Pyramimonas_sp.AAC.1
MVTSLNAAATFQSPRKTEDEAPSTAGDAEVQSWVAALRGEDKLSKGAALEIQYSSYKIPKRRASDIGECGSKIPRESF